MLPRNIIYFLKSIQLKIIAFIKLTYVYVGTHNNIIGSYTQGGYKLIIKVYFDQTEDALRFRKFI